MLSFLLTPPARTHRYVNGVLVHVRSERGLDAHHFKCGVYMNDDNATATMESFYSNIKIYEYFNSSSDSNNSPEDTIQVGDAVEEEEEEARVGQAEERNRKRKALKILMEDY